MAGFEVSCRVFVARPFDPTGQKIFANIVAPVLSCVSLEPVHGPLCNRKLVVEQVRATIEACGGVLSLLVGQNRNVLIETGIAIALRKPLFVLAQTPQDAGMLMDNFPVVLLGDQAMLRRELKAFADRLSSAGPGFE